MFLKITDNFFLNLDHVVSIEYFENRDCVRFNLMNCSYKEKTFCNKNDYNEYLKKLNKFLYLDCGLMILEQEINENI